MAKGVLGGLSGVTEERNRVEVVGNQADDAQELRGF
jgi:hypothetical protein